MEEYQLARPRCKNEKASCFCAKLSHYTMKMYETMEVQLHIFFTVALDGDN
jgi:hypothetical protein